MGIGDITSGGEGWCGGGGLVALLLGRGLVW